MELRPLVLLVCSLLAGTPSASAECVVKGSASAVVAGTATIVDGSSKVNTTLGGPASFQGDTILLTRLARPRIGSITEKGPVVKRALAHDRPIHMEDGHARVNGNPRGAYRFTWDTEACTVREASLGAVHLAWYFDQKQARRGLR